MERYLEQKTNESNYNKPEILDDQRVDQLANYLNLMGNYILEKVVGSNYELEDAIKDSGGLHIIYDPKIKTPAVNTSSSIEGLELPQISFLKNDNNKNLSFMTILGSKGNLDGVYYGDIDEKINNLRGFGMQFKPENKMIRVSMGDRLVMPPLIEVAGLVTQMVENRISYIEESL